MAKSNTRRNIALTKNEDRISELPHNLQDSILNLLSVRDAVRSSILSKKWRYCWTTIPSLVFDSEFVESIGGKLDQFQDPVIKTYEFVSLINKLLLLHNGPLIKFSIGFPEDCDIRILSDYIIQWIPLLSRYGVKKLTIENWVYGHLRTPINYDFDPRSFSRLKLTHLRLYSAEFQNTAALGGFSHLATLELVSCVNSAQTKWLLDCPVLEILTLEVCAGIFHTNFRAPKLRCLDLQSYEICLQGLETIEEFSFCLEIKTYPYTWKTDYNVVAVLGALHKIEKLSIGLFSLKHLAAAAIPLRLPQSLIYLKNLDISDVDFTDLSEVLCILCILRSTPNLCKLEISVTTLSISDDIGDIMKNYCAEGPIECTLNQLEIVTFNDFKGLNTELELMKFIFFHSPSLKKIFIRPSVMLKWKLAKEVAEEIQEYSFASKVAEIVLVKQH